MEKRNFSDTMIAAKDYEKLVSFYTGFVGLEVTESSEKFTMLVDREKKQCLCITNGESVSSTSPGILVTDLAQSLIDLKSMNGKILKTWEFASMKGANCLDPEGNELMIWQGSH